ncbi:MAG TPA: ABC transporter ATP-binding protein [Rhizomicrobium sp.]|jgi:ABC-2 type transport system ATP-binding protein|nr:ABC transporter ATP-binding protein [Rhizomicrobium sp.]
MIKIRDLVFEYPTARALDGVSLDVAPKAITALVGPNGAGKTTLMRLIAALDTPYAGSVAIDGLDTRHEPRAVHRKLGYLPDFFGLYDGLSVRRCLTYAARAHGLAAPEADAAVMEAAESVGLADRMDQAAGALSRGLRQRLAIAQALVHRPKLLLLDEPAAGLDPAARRDLSRLLLSLRDKGMTLVVSSHILAELEDYSDHMVIIDHGHVAGGTAFKGAQLVIALATPDVRLGDFLVQQAGIEILQADTSRARVVCGGGADRRASLLQALIGAGFAVSDFGEDRHALEDLYFAQLGRSGELRN